MIGPFEEARRALARLELAISALHWLALSDRDQWEDLLTRCAAIRQDLRFLETQKPPLLRETRPSGEEIGLEALAKASGIACSFCGQPDHKHPVFLSMEVPALRCDRYVAPAVPVLVK
jgi:hypothetical protein